ncbi:MAG: hypothetical protein ACNS63_09335 [Candidatus Nitrospinota bacterium M3_3B_026]
MIDRRVIVLTQGDPKFQSRIEPLLVNYDGAKVKYFDVCAFSLTGDEIKSADTVLINGDRFPLTEKCKRSFQSLSEQARENGRDFYIFMLTCDLKVEDFLRNQNYFVTDTIDISRNLDALRAALDDVLLAGVSGRS